jgi:hypothetical protein
MADQYVNLRPGLNNVGNYQVSGIPFVTGALTAPTSSGTPLVITFPSVTKRVIVHNSDTSVDCRVGFSENGVKNSNYFIAESDKSNNTSHQFDMNVKCTNIYILSQGAALTSKIFVAAELTGITGYDLATAYSGSAGIG